MRMLFIGDLNSHTESSSKENAFRELGLDVSTLSSERIPYLPGLGNASGLPDKLRRRFLPMRDINQINTKLKLMASNGTLESFDIIWSDKAINIRPDVLQKIRDACPNSKIIFASGDNVALPEFRNKAFENTIHIFDAVITSKSDTISQLKKLGANDVYYIPKAFDERWPMRLRKPEKCYDISFVGSFEKERAHSMLELARAGFEVNIWGNGWKKWKVKHENFHVHGFPVYQDDLIEIIETTKINLCFLRKLAKDKSTNRTFEIPACGGFMLAERTTEQRGFFAESVAAEFFETESELIAKTQYYLENDELRNRVAHVGHQTCLSSGYGYIDRCKQFLEQVLPKI